MVDDLKKTLRILKFFTNNDFAFKDVHNEQLFYQNGKIVVEVVQLFEHYRIIGSSDVQTLGDLFEQLLNKGFKQNEGQFFTPIPITRFIWDSLPIIDMIKTEHGIEYPKIIDYACGAGHFLTQGVEAVDAAVKKIDSTIAEDRSWVENKVYGIEKDYRLARVSKISLFMHGAGDANIIFGDGLENYADKGIVSGTFDILVANPPYAVKAFKSHMKLKDNDFRLLKKITNDGSEIEALFVERIAQLIKPKGLAAVILPSSILSNDSGSYIGAREELLQHFYIRAIACFGSKTFGATGTNTVVLFMQKIEEPPVRFKLVEDSADAILSGEPLTDWEDEKIYEMYLVQVEADKNFYDKLIAEAEPYRYFAEDNYLKNYVAAFEELTDVKAKKKQKAFNKLGVAEQAKWMNQRFYSFVKEKEKEKLMYFAMVYKQTVLIITAPADNVEQKAFLGYDWSNRKGNEGIVINTPGGMLYDDADRFAEDTFSGLIRGSFNEEKSTLPGREKYYRYADLKDMIDFEHVAFNKAIKTTAMVKIHSKYQLETVGSLLINITGNTTKVANEDIKAEGSVPVVAQNTDSIISGFVETDKAIDDLPVILFGDHTCCFKYIDFPFVRGADGTQLLKVNSSVLPKYLYYVLPDIEIENKDKYERHFKYLKQSLVPVPPLNIQQKIVDECSQIDEEYSATRAAIEEYRAKTETLFADLDATNRSTVKLDSIAKFVVERIASDTIPATSYITTDNMHQQCAGIREYNAELPNGSVVAYQAGDILLSNIRPYLKKIWFADRNGGCSPDVLVLRTSDKYNPHFLYYQLRRQQYFDYVMEDVSGVKMPRGKKAHILNYGVYDLPIAEQSGIAAKIEAYDAEIIKMQTKLENISEKKQEVLKRYL